MSIAYIMFNGENLIIRRSNMTIVTLLSEFMAQIEIKLLNAFYDSDLFNIDRKFSSVVMF